VRTTRATSRTRPLGIRRHAHSLSHADIS